MNTVSALAALGAAILRFACLDRRDGRPAMTDDGVRRDARLYYPTSASSAFATSNTASNIAGVSRPVFVLRREQW